LWDIVFGRKTALFDGTGHRERGGDGPVNSPVVENAAQRLMDRWSELAAHDRLVVGLRICVGRHAARREAGFLAQVYSSTIPEPDCLTAGR
jgi:hypothetical protein